MSAGTDEHVLSTLLVRLLVLPNGRLWHNKLVDPVLRGALMVDWVASGRLTEQDAELDLDTTRTGNPAADALLARIAAEPDRPLTHWLAVDQPTLARFATYLTKYGVLAAYPQRFRPTVYSDPCGYDVVMLRDRLRGIVIYDDPDEPAIVALAVLAQLLGLLGAEADTSEATTLDRCGPLSWLVRAVNEWAAAKLEHMRSMEHLSFGNSD